MPGDVLQITARLTIPLREITFRTARSSGPGGQNVNKLETKVELMFDARTSSAFSGETRSRVLAYLNGTAGSEGLIRIVSQRSRSQWQNKQDALARLADMIRAALRPIRKRKPTAPTYSSRQTRVEGKRRRSGVKRMRGNPLRDAD